MSWFDSSGRIQDVEDETPLVSSSDSSSSSSLPRGAWVKFGLTILVALLALAVVALSLLYAFQKDASPSPLLPPASPPVSWLGPLDPTLYGIGSINAVAMPAQDYATVFIGSSNGGVWRCDDLSPFQPPPPPPPPQRAPPQRPSMLRYPLWRNLTDHLPCSSASSVATSPDDPSFVVFGCGKVSSYLFYSGPLSGVFFSADRGDSWQASDLPFGWDIAKLVVLPGPSNTVVAAAKSRQVQQPDSGFVWQYDHEDGGVFISRDGGASFQAVADPLVAHRSVMDVEYAVLPNATDGGQETVALYASLTDGRIVASFDGGLAWETVSQSIDYSGMGPIVNSRVAVGRDVVYALVCDADENGVVAWAQLGTTAWTQTPIPMGLAKYGGVFFFDLTVDPYTDSLFYIGGAVDAVYLGNTQLYPADVFSSLTSADNAPHADTRFLVFNPAANVMLLGCDGGVYSLAQPQQPLAQQWQSQNGNLSITELDSVAYDPRSGTVASGAQDNGIFITLGPQLQRQLNLSVPYFMFTDVGDGESVQINSAVDPSVLYGSGQYLGGLFAYAIGSDPFEATIINVSIAGVESPFYTDLQLNTVDLALMMICGADGAVCWQVDFQQDPLDPEPPVQLLFDMGPNATAISNYFYGGQRGGASYPDVFMAIAGNDFIVVKDASDALPRVLDSNRQWYLYRDSMQLRNPKYRLAVNPLDYYEACTPTLLSRIHYTTNFGASWLDISGNLAIITGAVADPEAWGVAIIPLSEGTEGSAILVGTTMGVYVCFSAQLGIWFPLTAGSDLPNVLISNLEYSAVDDLLIIATMGRGWWTLSHASHHIHSIYDYYISK